MFFKTTTLIGRLSYIGLTCATGVFDPSSCSSVIDNGIIDTGSEGRSMIMLCDTLEPSKEAMPPSMSQGSGSMTQTPMTQQKTSRLIPAGRYRVIIDHSNRFNRDLPLLINVAGFTGIRIHRGNSAKDTQGCILCGINDKTGWISDSAIYEQKIISLIRKYRRGWITVRQ